MARRRPSPSARLLLHGPGTRRGRFGAYLWNASCAWHERSMPRHRLLAVVARDICRGQASVNWSLRPVSPTT